MTQLAILASQHVLPAGTLVDAAGITHQLRRQDYVLPVPQLTQTTTTLGGYAIVRSAGEKIAAISLYYPGVVPACSGGTATIQIDAVAADGTTTVNIVAAVTLLSGITTKVPLALTLAATNPATLAVGSSILVTVVTSNNSVGAAGVGGTLKFHVEQLPDTAPTYP